MGKCGDEGAAAKREGMKMEVGFFSQFTWGVGVDSTESSSMLSDEPLTQWVPPPPGH